MPRDSSVDAQVEVPPGIAERIRALCLALPEVTVRVDLSRVRNRSTAYSFDVRRRSFCLLVAVADPDGEPVPRLVLRGGRDRIGVRLTGDPDWAEIRELITESYRILAPRKLTAQLDGTGPGQ